MVGPVVDMAGEDTRTRVFLSYSRKDKDLVARIADGLMAAGFLPDFDQAAHDPDNVSAGISAEDEWWKRLQEMIAAADVMVFLVSPDSATSAVCDEEIAYARALGKRIIAVLAREVDFARAPPRLSALNVRIDFSGGGPGFDAALAGLTRALEMNVGWHREGRKYYARVQEWDGAGRPKSRLLREGAVEEAERWALARPRNEPEPGELFLAWIAASRAQIKRDAAVRAFWRRVTAVFVVTTLVATLAGAWFVINGQRSLGRSESLMLARTSDQFYNKGDYLRALHLAILASRSSFFSPSTDEAKAAFAKSAHALSHLVSVRQDLMEGESGDAAYEKSIERQAVSPDGRRLATWDHHGWVTLWDTTTGAQVGAPFRMRWGVSSGAGLFSADSSRFVIWDQGGAQVVDAETGEKVGRRLSDAGTGADEDGHLVMAAFAPDTHRLATLHPSQGLRLWDTRDASLVAEADLPPDAQAARLRMSADGQVLYAAAGDSVRFWRTDTGAPARPVLLAGEALVGAALSPRDDRIVTWGYAREAALWDAAGRRTALAGCHSGQMVAAQFIVQTERIVTQASGGEVCVWDAATGRQVGPRLLHNTGAGDPAISPDGRRIFTVTYLGGGRLGSLETGEAAETPEADAGAVRGGFSPDGRYLVTQDYKQVRVWLAQNYQSAGLAVIEPGSSAEAVFSPDSRYLAVLDADQRVRVFDVVGGTQLGGALPHTDYFDLPQFLPGGRILTVADNVASIWNVETWTLTGPKLPEWGFHYGAMMSPDGKRVLTWTEEGQAALWDTFAETEIGNGLLVGEQGYWGAAFDTLRPQMALWYEGAVQLVNTDTGEGSEALMEHDALVRDGMFLLGGARLLVTTQDGGAHLWDTESFSKLGTYMHDSPFQPLVSPTGDRVLIWDGPAAVLIDAAAGAPLGLPLAHARHSEEDEGDGDVSGGAFSADGRVLATWNMGEVRSWNAADGTALGLVIIPGKEVHDVSVSPDGRRLAVVTGPEVVIYDTAQGMPLTSPMVHAHAVYKTDFSSDGRTLAALTIDYRGQLWETATGKAKGDPLQLGSESGHARFFLDDRRLLVWDDAGSQVIHDAATGTELARNPQFDFFAEPVIDIQNGRMQTIDTNGRVRLLDIRFALRTDATAEDVAQVCAAKLNSALSARGVPFVRELDAEAIFAAPILRGREGEDVCAPEAVPWWERAAGAVFGWAFN